MPSFLFFSLEFAKGTVFSGNGVLANTYARELARTNHRVDVVCCTPVDDSICAESEPSLSVDEDNIAVIALPVPASKWRKLDWMGPFREFEEQCSKLGAAAAGASGAGGSQFLKGIFDSIRSDKKDSDDDYDYDNVLIIDWHGYVPAMACDALNRGAAAAAASTRRLPRTVWLNFRIFCNFLLGDANSEEYLFYRQHELQAALHTDITLVLSQTDAELLRGMLPDDDEEESQVIIDILPPPLQAAFLDIVKNSDEEKGGPLVRPFGDAQQQQQTFLLTCCVRLDPTKGAHKFVEVVEALMKKNNNSNISESSSSLSLVRSSKHKSARLIPFLCGAAADADYASSVRGKLREVCPDAVIRTDFVTPQELAAAWHSAAMNVHPARYDAYGMSVVEGTSLGVLCTTHGTPYKGDDPASPSSPSSSSSSSSALPSCSCFETDDNKRALWKSPVGAAGLLEAAQNEIVLTDWTRNGEEIAHALEPLLVRLLDRCCVETTTSTTATTDKELEQWITGARKRALSWDAEAAVKQLIEFCQRTG